jgi:hypothetical protein
MAQISALTGTWEIGVNWPYPKLYFTDYYIMAVARKGTNLALYDMTNSGNVWTATERFEFSAASGIINIDIAGFNTYAVIVVNKGATKEIYEKNYSTKAVTLTAVTTRPAGNSCCNHNGQLVIGGVYSSGAPWSGLTACSVAWSDVGSNVVLPGNVNGTSDLTAGFAKMPWDENGNGKVFKVLSLGDSIIVYGDRGIASLKQTIISGFPAVITEFPAGIGVASNYSVAGNSRVHGFVDTNFDWNLVTKEGVKNLGYRNYLELLTGLIVVSFDESTNRFYISNGIVSFVFNQAGMYSTNQCVSSIGRYKGILTGFVLDNGDSKIRVKTVSVDAGIQDMKTVESVETGVVYITDANEAVYGKVMVRYDYRTDSFMDGDFVEINDRGIFTSKKTGREFKIVLESDYESRADFRLNDIKLKIKFSDKRNSRGKRDAS